MSTTPSQTFRPTPELLRCATCDAAMAIDRITASGPTRCPACGATARFTFFPAFLRPREAAHVAPAVMLDDESSCFYHPTKQAAVPCDGCGRFLCALCDFEVDGEHLCSACLESGRGDGNLKRIQPQLTRYDILAFAVSFVPFLFMFIPVLITGPLIVYWSIRYGRRREGQLSLGRGWFIAAGLITLFHLVMLGFVGSAFIVGVAGG